MQIMKSGRKKGTTVEKEKADTLPVAPKSEEMVLPNYGKRSRAENENRIKTELICKNFVISGSLKWLIIEKIGRLGKYFFENVTAKVSLSKTASRQYTMEITIPVGRTIVRAEARGVNQYDNVDAILPKIEKQIIKYRAKCANIKSPPFEFLYTSGYSDFREPRVVKEKTVELVPMSVEDAMTNIELIGHDFFIFYNEDTELVNLIYKRKDGDFGLIVLNY